MKKKTLVLTALLTVWGTAMITHASFAQPGPSQPSLTISPTTLPDGKYGSAYASQTLTATGGTSPYSFSVSKGKLPAGMSLSAGGVLSGTPTVAGTYKFTVTAQDNSASGAGGAPPGGPGSPGPPNPPGGGPGSNGNGSGPITGTSNFVLVIDPAPLTITADNQTMSYGTAVPALTVTYTGFVNGDNAADLDTKPGVTTTATPNSQPGAYPITVSGAKDANYTFDYVAGTMTVGHATLNIKAISTSMTYGGSVPALSVTYSGFINGDNASSLSAKPIVTATAAKNSPAGTYPISASGAADPKYTIVYTAGTLTIDPAAARVTATAESKTFGEPDPNLAFTVTGLVNGDNSGSFSGSLSRSPGENVGNYPITIGTLSAGGNYKITYTGSTLTIKKAAQQITWDQTLLIGCVAATQVQLTATSSSGLPVSYSVSDNTVSTVSGNLLTLLKPGTAVVTATQTGNADYGAAQTVSDTIRYQNASLISQHWNDVIFFDNSSGDYMQWQWYKDGQAVSGDTTPYYTETPALDGQYYVIATNKDGQQIQSCTLDITPGAGIPGGIQASPNPVSRGAAATITCHYPASALQGAILMVADISGRALQQIANVQPSMQVTMPSAAGIYIVGLLLATGQQVSVNVLVRD